MRADLSLVDTKLLTKPNVHSGEHDDKERWSTLSFKMRAYCAAMAQRLRADGISEPARIGDQARRDDSERRTTQHELVLHPESVDRWRGAGHCAKQSREQRNGSVTSDGDALGIKSSLQGSRNAASILVTKIGYSCSAVTQLLTAWEKQAQDYQQQSGDDISDASKLGVVLRHLPDASLREHLLFNSRAYDTYIMMAAEYEQWTWREHADGSECTREGCCLSCVLEERSSCPKLLAPQKNQGVAKERKARKVKERHKTQGWRHPDVHRRSIPVDHDAC